jgi:hypothetical protein
MQTQQGVIISWITQIYVRFRKARYLNQKTDLLESLSQFPSQPGSLICDDVTDLYYQITVGFLLLAVQPQCHSIQSQYER